MIPETPCKSKGKALVAVATGARYREPETPCESSGKALVAIATGARNLIPEKPCQRSATDKVRFQGWGSNCSTQRRDDSARNEIFPQARLATTAVAHPQEQQQQEPRAKSQAVVAVHARVEDKDPHHPLCCARRKEKWPKGAVARQC